MPDSTMSFYIDGPTVIFYGAQNCDAAGYTSPFATYTVGADSFYVGNLLGFTDGGATISYQAMTHRINGDEYGGSEGMPAELLMLGLQATIRAPIVKWGAGAFEAVMMGLNSMTPGVIPRIGTPYFSGQYGYSFWVVGIGSGKSYYFPKCELATQAKQWNVSALERRMDLNIQAYNVFYEIKDNGNTSSYASVFFEGTETNIPYNDDCSATFA